jgi:hypothetical protein
MIDYDDSTDNDTDDSTNATYRTIGSGFQFSAISADDMGASEYTLVAIAADKSSSVYNFATEIEKCLVTSLQGCMESPRVDNLLVRLLTFNSQLDEIHGYKHLADCPIANYQGIIKPGGCTSLFDACISSIDSLATLGKQMIRDKYTANGLSVIITDGMDVGSTQTINAVAEAIARSRRSECLESILNILIGINVNEPEVSQALNTLKTVGKFDEYIEAKDASPKTFARIAKFISRSISSQSQAIQTGQASTLITF